MKTSTIFCILPLVTLLSACSSGFSVGTRSTESAPSGVVPPRVLHTGQIWVKPGNAAYEKGRTLYLSGHQPHHSVRDVDYIGLKQIYTSTLRNLTYQPPAEINTIYQ